VLYDPRYLPSVISTHQSINFFLLIILVSVIVNDVEESELVDTLRSRHNTEPIPELLLLEELLGQVLEVSSREVDVRNNLDLSIANLRDLHNVAEVTDTAVDLDLVLEELLEGGDIEDFVAGGLRGVDDELLSNLCLLALRARLC